MNATGDAHVYRLQMRKQEKTLFLLPEKIVASLTTDWHRTQNIVSFLIKP